MTAALDAVFLGLHLAGAGPCCASAVGLGAEHVVRLLVCSQWASIGGGAGAGKVSWEKRCEPPARLPLGLALRCAKSV